MPVPSVITDLNTTAASNSPAGTDPIGSTLDDYLRAIQAIVRREQAQGAVIASSATTNIGSNLDGNFVRITGTTTITSFDTVPAGVRRTLVFDASLVLTHNISKIILPGGANVTTNFGDIAEFVSEGSGTWRCIRYLFSSAMPLTKTSADALYATPASVSSAISSAISAQDATVVHLANTETITGAKTFNIPPIAKNLDRAWVNFNGTGTVAVRDSYNVTSVTDLGVGLYTVNFTVSVNASGAFKLGWVADVNMLAGGTPRQCRGFSQAANAITIETGTEAATGGSRIDFPTICLAVTS